MTSATLTSLRQAEDEYLQKFMDRFRRIVVQINNLNPDIALHCMLLALRLGKFAGSLCKKKKNPSSMDELCEQAKGYIQMEEKSRFRNEHYTPLKANHTTILEEAFNLEVPIKLPPSCPPRPRLDATKYYRYHCSIGHNTKDCWALKVKIEELIQAGYL